MSPKEKKTRRFSLIGEDLFHGMDLAILQAKLLCHEAQILLESGSPSTPHALAILAIEEVGKALLLRNTLLEGDGSWQYYWDRYSQHKYKLRAAFNFYSWLCEDSSRILSQALQPIPRELLFQPNHPKLGDIRIFLSIREAALYTDFNSETGRFSGPDRLSPDVQNSSIKLGRSITDWVDMLVLADRSKGSKTMSAGHRQQLVRTMRNSLLEGGGNPVEVEKLLGEMEALLDQANGGVESNGSY